MNCKIKKGSDKMFSNTIPLYLINGFLEGGKTSFIQDVLTNGDFADGQKTLLILCEEGEVEYDQSELTNLNILSLTVLDSPGASSV